MPRSILIHIGRSKDCKEFYGPRLDEMKQKKARERKRKSRDKNGIKKELKKQRESYASSSEKKRKEAKVL